MTLERRLAGLLRYGTWLATAVTAAGLAGLGPRVAVTGIALIVAIPIARLGVMLAAYAHARDRRFASTTAAVLTIVLASIALGVLART